MDNIICNNGHVTSPPFKFTTWDFVNTRKGKSRKKYVQLPSLRSVASVEI